MALDHYPQKVNDKQQVTNILQNCCVSISIGRHNQAPRRAEGAPLIDIQHRGQRDCHYFEKRD